MGEFRLQCSGGSNYRRIKSDRHRLILTEAIATDHKRGERSAKIVIEGNGRGGRVRTSVSPSKKGYTGHDDQCERKNDRGTYM